MHPASSTYFNTKAYYADITVSSADIPHIAIYGPAMYGVIACSKSGNNWTFRIVGASNSTIGNPPITWFQFDAPVSLASGSGAEIYDGSGKCMYSTSCPPIDVASFRGSGLGDYSEISLPSNRKYASIFTAKISLTETQDVYTNLEIVTYWTYDFIGAYCEVNPSPYDASVKRCGFGNTAINAGTNQGSHSPTYPAGDLGGWGAASSFIAVDVTRYLT